jgi:HTH-type transcriptional regulator/antitoxin HipB
MAALEGQNLPSRLGDAICAHRKAAGLTQMELAKLAGVGKTVVFDIEKGKTTVRLATLLRVLEALNLRLEWHSPLTDTGDA